MRSIARRTSLSPYHRFRTRTLPSILTAAALSSLAVCTTSPHRVDAFAHLPSYYNHASTRPTNLASSPTPSPIDDDRSDDDPVKRSLPTLHHRLSLLRRDTTLSLLLLSPPP